MLSGHPDTGSPSGIFEDAYRLAESSVLTAGERGSLRERLNWFDQNLPKPSRFNRSKSKGFYRRATKGVSWFKPTATDHLRHAREIAVLMEAAGHAVREITATQPGYVVYEDEFQIVAEPFAESPKK
jgi:hypothetical protein